MLRLRLQKLGSILGLLAILMTTFAPAISQALAANERVDALLGAYCSVHNADGFTQAAQGDHSKSSPSLPHLDACGFCHFFSHAPAVHSANAMLASAFSVGNTQGPSLHQPAPRSPTLFSAQPRAPPSLA
jgi:hypothetical protein